MSWPTPSLDEISEKIDYGVTASAKHDGQGSKFLRITDIQDGAVDWSQVPYCDAPAKKLRSARLESGDIVFARTGATTGKSYLISDPPEEAVFASYLIRVRPSRAVVPAYLAHFFRTAEYWRQIKAKSQGAAQEGVNATKLSSLSIPLPPLDEQRRIAAILDKADSLRNKRKQAIALLDSLTQSIFLEMFGDPVSNPKGWENVDFLSLLAEGLRNGVSPSKAGKIPFKVLTLSAVTGNAFDLNSLKIGNFHKSIPEYQIVSSNDFLICRGNGNRDLVGRGFFASNDMPDTAFPDTIIAARIDQGKITKNYLESIWAQRLVRRQIEAGARTTNGTFKVNQSVLESISFPCPPMELQKEFERRVSALASKCRAACDSMGSFGSLFASLQHRAFAGEL